MRVREILERLLKGEIDLDSAERMIRAAQVLEVGEIARIDINREVRAGIPEIILAEGKSPDDVIMLARAVVEKRGRVIISRASRELFDAIRGEFPPSEFVLSSNERARVVVVKSKDFRVQKLGRKIGIITAGTSDIPVAEEARVLLEELGCDTVTAYDVGIAGVHRVFPVLKRMLEEDVDAIIVVAGMEGALPSLVASLVDVPVIGVPTSSGYGYGGKGKAALMAMLQTCVPGLVVVNIDNGIGAAAFAYLISKRIADVLRRR